MVIFTIQLSRGQNKMAAVGHLEILCFDIIALEFYVIPHFLLEFEYTDSIGHLGVKTKMAVIGHIEFFTFYRIVLESCVIPHFDQF